METWWVNALWSVTPTAILAVLFWLIIRSILRADRTERDEFAKVEEQERAKRGMKSQGSS
jgi:flagellar biosynthesis/type III secretory pathway M-ring protein FliF/YscJ